MAADHSQPEPLRRGLTELSAAVDELIVDLLDDGRHRVLLGVAGPPGSGKSTVAHRVVARAVGRVAAEVAPMDGFHLPNEALNRRGLLPLKGVPDSFDASAFVAHLRLLRADPAATVVWPTYDRSTQSVVSGGVIIEPAARLIVVEGNYLLLESSPWDQVRPLLDTVWYLDVPRWILEPRLLERQGRNRSPREAAEKVASTDLPDAAIVEATKNRADLILVFDSTPPSG